jgi:hypothetical protein
MWWANSLKANYRQHSVDKSSYILDKHNIKSRLIKGNNNNNNKNNTILVYLHANLTAQRQITKIAQVWRKTQNN